MDRERLKDLVTAECRRLAKLGSADAIAQELASRGMQGERRSECRCPLALGLADTLMMSPGRLFVFPYAVTTGLRHGGEYLAEFEDELGILGAFVLAFDAGKWPHLQAS